MATIAATSPTTPICNSSTPIRAGSAAIDQHNGSISFLQHQLGRDRHHWQRQPRLRIVSLHQYEHGGQRPHPQRRHRISASSTRARPAMPPSAALTSRFSPTRPRPATPPSPAEPSRFSRHDHSGQRVIANNLAPWHSRQREQRRQCHRHDGCGGSTYLC